MKAVGFREVDRGLSQVLAPIGGWRWRRWAYACHALLGASAGLFLTLVCFTGSLAAVSQDIDTLFSFGALGTGYGESLPRAWSDYLRVLESEPDVASVNTLLAHNDSVVRAMVETRHGVRRWMYVDADSATILADIPFFNAQRILRDFHRKLFAGRVGHYAVCLMSLFLLASALSGWMIERRPWRRLSGPRPKHARGIMARWHVTMGLLSLPFLCVFGITGAWYLAERAGEDLGYRFVTSDPAPAAMTDEVALSIDVLVARAQHAHPELRARGIAFDGRHVFVEGQSSGWFLRDRANRVVLDRHQGTVVQILTPSMMSWTERWAHTADPLHFGSFGGFTVRWLWCFAGLLLCGLCLSGTKIHARRIAHLRGDGGVA